MCPGARRVLLWCWASIMADPLASVRFKLERAVKHLDEIAELVRPVEYRPVRVVTEDDLAAQRVHLRVEFDDSFDPRVGVVIGDGLHNLRSALDHLISSLADY